MLETLFAVASTGISDESILKVGLVDPLLVFLRIGYNCRDDSWDNPI